MNSIDLNFSERASPLHQLKKAHDLALQITPKIEANNNVINLISAHAARVHKHNNSISLAPRKRASNADCNLSN